ncbi:MAG: rRNA maturation RNase YbeY [Pseudomonadota bacterium]
MVRRAASLALPSGQAECTVRLVDADESRSLNHRHRGRDQATNVLSFPAALADELAALLPEDEQPKSIGDIVLCVAVAEREAADQGKQLGDHLTHLIVHGILHLRGFDHITESEAQEMEQLERELLAEHGIADPYRIT